MRRWAAIVILLVAVAGGAYWAGRQASVQQKPTDAAPAPEPDVASSGVLRLAGVVRSANPVDVLPDTSGVVQSLHVRRGDPVKEGDLLAIVRNEAFEAIEQRLAREYQSLEMRVENLEKSVAQSRLQLTQLRSELQGSESKLRVLQQEAERQRLLFAEGATARQQYQRAQTDAETAERQHAALEQVLRTAETQLSSQEQSLGIDRYALADKLAEWEAAKGDVGLGEVLAPVEGVVTEIRVVEGAETGPNSEPMMEIAPVEAVRYAVVEPNEVQMRRIRVGQPALVRPETVSDVRELPGTVFGFRGQDVLVEFLDEGNRLPPGAAVRVEIDTTGDELI
jgi:multidrug resistance efflux pump